MSLEVNGEKCAICKAYLFEDDDIAYCPECGAPHHRECYISLGHCGLEEYHGTENEYKKTEHPKTDNDNNNIDTITCGMCGAKYNRNDSYCPSCNAPNLLKHGVKFASFDFMGGVPSETDLGDGITANEAKKFVALNTHRYIPKFLKLNNGSKASWNWMAFLTPSGWLMSRKMYVLGIVVIAIQIALSFLTLPFNEAISYLDFQNARNYMEVSRIILDNVSVIGKTPIILASISGLCNIILTIIVAIFGDFFYKKYTISSIKEIKTNDSLDEDEAYRKKGGVSLLAAIIGYFSVNVLPTFFIDLMRMFQ